MRIGEVARALEVSRDTVKRFDPVIRPARDWTGHRRYGPEDLAKLRELLFKREGIQP
jgi:DNA-binding transcriptional MerR regulator